MPCTPGAEVAVPGFDENLQTVIARTECYITEWWRPKAPASRCATHTPRGTD